MRIAEADILILPGLGNSGPGHWQRRWGERFPHVRYVDQDDWDHPTLNDWVGRLHQEIMLATRPVVLVAHSLAIAAVAHTAQRLADTKVRGAFLVSPPDLEDPDVLADLRSLDPAMGSGAFLLGALERLVALREAAGGQSRAQATRRVIEENLFGVAVSATAVTIAGPNPGIVRETRSNSGTTPSPFAPTSTVTICSER